MHRIDCPTATPDHRFTEGNPTIPVMATVVTADWLTSVQEEICSVISAAKIELDKSAEDQLLKAIKVIIGKTVPLATLALPGLVKPDGATLSIKPDGTIYVTPAAVYELAEFYLFRHPTPRPGFEVLDGHIVEGAAELYSDAWNYLQSSDGQLLCKTEEEWQELSTKTYYTLADGTKVGFNGIGGVGYYSLNTATGSIRMPDIRGQFFGAAQSASLNVPISVGESDIDRMRKTWGSGWGTWSVAGNTKQAGGFYWQTPEFAGSVATLATPGPADLAYDNSRVAPTGSVTAPPRISMLACAYMGQPAG